MKRYLSRVVPILALIVVFVMATYLDIPNNIKKNVRLLANENKLAGSCNTGEGTLYYVDAASGLNIRNTAGETGKVLSTLSKCTVIRVYCTDGNWGKVSKTSEKWVSLTYVSTNRPTGCSLDPITTTTDSISFDFDSITAIPAPDYDKMYLDRNGKIVIKAKNIKNVASDDADLFDVKVTKNNQDVTSDFIIEKELSGSNITFTLNMSDAEDGTKYSSGSYSVTVSAGKDKFDTNFSLVEKYYNFTSSYEKNSGPTGSPGNKKNTWQVTFSNLVAIDMNYFSYVIKKDNTDVTWRFDISRNNNVYNISNKTEWWGRPDPGKYNITFTYSNTEYSNSRGSLVYSFDIVIGSRDIRFDRESIESHRYIRTKDNVPYVIKLVSKTTTNKITNITYIENNETIKVTEDVFTKTFVDFDLSKVVFTKAGNIAYRYNELCTITKYLNGVVTYQNDSGTVSTSPESEFEVLYPGAYSVLTGGNYDFDASGNLMLNLKGTKVVDGKRISPKNQNIFAGVGGEFYMTYSYDDLDKEDFEQSEYKIFRESGEVVNASDLFYFSWTYDNDYAYIKVIYDNQDAEKYQGNYYVRIYFKNAGYKDVPFVLYDGEVDFYLTSQVDGHLTSTEPLESVNPPGNQRYEHYLGFYLIKGGKVQTTKNAKMIDVKIFDHFADLDENGDLYYYDQVEYLVKITKFINNKVTYQVTENNKTRTETKTLEEFTSLYSDAAKLINKYTYDANGNLTDDNYELHIKKFYNDETIADMRVTYVDAAGKTHNDPLNDFKVQYPEMYGYLVTRFNFDEDGNILLGSISGAYRVYEYDGNPIEGNEITDQFSIEIDNSSTNIEKAISILPKTEVDAGTYYVYVSYDSLQGVGFVNNDEDAVITKELYPEMWEQNIHMTMITYDEPVYSLNIEEPTLSNIGNTSEKIYNNIEGTANFAITPKYIYDYSGLTYSVEYYNGTNWVDASSHFTGVNSLDSNSDEYNIENPRIVLTTVVGVAKSGKYRLKVNYTNKGQSCNDTQEFEIAGKYYGLIIDTSEAIRFIHNYTSEKIIFSKGYFINDPSKITPSITRLVNGGTNEYLVHDAANKQFKNSLGEVVFNYSYQVDEDYYNEEDTISYQFYISNVGNVTAIGNYEIEFSYQETNNDISVSKTSFVVGEDEYYINLKNEVPKANEDSMTITMDIETKFINYDDLDSIDYIVYYYDKNQRKYVDVSSTKSTNRMFIVTDVWDQNSGPDYKGKVTFTLEQDSADMAGYYYIIVKFKDVELEFPMSSLNDLFSWNVDSYDIVGIYHEDIIDENGNVVDNKVQVNKFYNNISDTTINIKLKSAHENNISWKINKECLENSCDPTTGTDYNSRFIATNTTGTDKMLKLKLREDLTDKEKLTPGTYALTLYYSKTDYKVLRLVVYSEFARIEFGEALIYSDITNDKVKEGLFKNKNGHVYIPVTVNGVPYENVEINITDATAENSFNSYFSYDRLAFNEDHVLDIKYNKNTDLTPGRYLVMVSYRTAEELISDTLYFDMNSTYYNFEINNPTYSPDPLIPNAEDGGVASFKIDTEDIPYITNGINNIDSLSNKHVFAKNTTIKNIEGNDVTNNFTITATNIGGEQLSFNLNVAYGKNEVEPGYYILTTYYSLDGYVIEKSSSFELGDYLKTLTIKGVEIITNTNDGRMHKNVSGTYRINYTSEYDLALGNITAKVIDSKGTDVSNKFEIGVYEKYIDVKYNAVEPYIESGDYKVIINYTDPSSNKVTTNEVDIKMYATYKEISIYALNQSASTIYSDRENQYFTFNVKTSTLTDDDISLLKAKIFDSKGRMVYSDITVDNVVNKFEVINNLKNTDANYRINVLPFKATIGEYTIRLYLEDEDGEYNYSNALTLKINSNYYKIALSTDSTLEQVKNYNTNDKTSIYDKDGAKGNYKFTSTYPSTDYHEYSIQVLKDGISIKEIDIDVEKVFEDGINLLVTEFVTDKLDKGTYDVALALNGLPYVTKTIDVVNYIKTTKVTMVIDGKDIDKEFIMYNGQIKKATFKVEPANATDVNFEYSSSDDNIAVFNNGKIEIKGVGTATITLKNSDIEVSAKLTSEQRITSDVYTMDYDNSIIYIKTMKDKKLTKKTFTSNLIGLVNGYKILNTSSKDITNTTELIGTGMTIKNADETYVVVLIGDINGDGMINVFDNSMLFQHVRGKKKITNKYKLQAADIRKQNKISIFDVSKLFQFIRNKISSI